MAEIAVIGHEADVGGFVLAGARVYPAETDDDVRAAWLALPPTVGFVLLSPAAARALDDELGKPSGPLTVVLP
jgi:vacuolar-type H+-ATPase subunit F/Vma7